MGKRTLDFSNVKEQGDFAPRHVEEGDYTATVTKFSETTKKDDSNKTMWVFTIVLDDKPSGRYPYYCTLNEEALWKIRNLLVAGGFKVPKKRISVDPEKVVGKKIGVHMVDDEYNGQMKSVVDAVFPTSDAEENTVSDDSDDDEEEDTPPPKKSAKKRKPEPEPEEDDEDDEDDEEEPPPPPKKSKKGKVKPAPKPDPDDEDDDDDDLEVDDEDL